MIRVISTLSHLGNVVALGDRHLLTVHLGDLLAGLGGVVGSACGSTTGGCWVDDCAGWHGGSGGNGRLAIPWNRS